MILTRSAKHRFLSQIEILHGGRLRLTTPEKTLHVFGDGQGPEVDFDLRDWSLLPALALRGDLALGEGYVDGRWDSTQLEELLQLLLRNLDGLSPYATQSPLSRAALVLADRLVRMNSIRGASRNIRAHYDVGNEFYHLWLDRGMAYSSALFAEGDDLETAQARKMHVFSRSWARVSPS